MTEADLAHAAPDFSMTGFPMGQLRTANKRRIRVALAAKTRKQAEATPAKADA